MMKVLDSIVIAPVWSGHPVGFDLLTYGQNQFVAFYDADRQMTVASRSLDSSTWEFFHPKGKWLEERNRLSTTIGWDSHNSLTMAIDDIDQIHLCGNMHVDPLIYFRTEHPLKIGSFERIDRMTGELEGRCTYPVFMRGIDGELIFRYRNGMSGNGSDYYNVYDPRTRKWTRLLNTPLLDGEDLMNAYAGMPRRGPDGAYHMVWMWRDTPDCSTNHDLSYARSQDLVNWETGSGKWLKLPITLGSDAIVDPVPAGGGLINMTQSLGFDANNCPVIGYQKYDSLGRTQAYNARLEGEEWKIYQTSDWDYRWEFSGGGSIAANIQIGEVKVEADGGLSQQYWHIKEGTGIWKLEEGKLKPIGTYPSPKEDMPRELLEVKSEYSGLEVRTVVDHGRRQRDSIIDVRGYKDLENNKGRMQETGIKYVLRWETLGSNRDQPRDKFPPPGELRLYKLQSK